MDVSEGTEEEDSEQEELMLMQQAVAEKERGNEYFKVLKNWFISVLEHSSLIRNDKSFLILNLIVFFPER